MADEDKSLAQETVDHIRTLGIGERAARFLGDDLLLYQDYKIKIKAGSRRYDILIEDGPDMRRVREELTKILSGTGIEDKDLGIVVSRQSSLSAGGVSVVLNMSKMNDREKRFHAYFREGFKPVMRAIYFSQQ